MTMTSHHTPRSNNGRRLPLTWLGAIWISIFVTTAMDASEPREISGIYPHLAMFNNEGECGTGAVVPWADRLWVITYAPHKPNGSSDKLYEITSDLQQIIRPESIGGTPANRMIHRESAQLFIGPYAIGVDRNVRVISCDQMYGRLTGNARHLTNPADKLYYATMEEGVYEVDVQTLAVTELWADEQKDSGRHADLPGYHGKGLYSGQGRLVYANNGEHGREAERRPDIPSGVLASWDGDADAWTVVRRNQFTEVTGPGGIYGNEHPGTDPLWSVGWDHRSLILMVLDRGEWHSYRLPKASHSYDGAHGWNTEWPRIRDVGEPDLLMTMHGMFWRFPRTFSPAYSAGIVPRSTYLKVIGDFCQWNGRLVFGCDDTASNEFLNKRRAKGEIAAPQSQSNLWFVEPDRLDRLGPVLGRGGPWVEEDVQGGAVSEPFLLAGFERRGLHLAHEGDQPVRVVLEVDLKGDGAWSESRQITVPARGYRWLEITEPAVWIRLRAADPLTGATAWFQLSNGDPRSANASPIFDGLAAPDSIAQTGGTVRARGKNLRTLAFAAYRPGPEGPAEVGYYELDADLKLSPVEASGALKNEKKYAPIPVGVLELDAASVLFTDDEGRRWRIPRGDGAFDRDGALGPCRVDREIATERDLFNAHGTFYELPADNAGGFAKLRPVTTHNRRVQDYCSYRGLLIMSGIGTSAPAENPHIVQSDDGRTALWVGAIDDIWGMGKPRGVGGPWKETRVRAAQPSDPYLMTGYDRKRLSLSHRGEVPVRMTVEIDLTGTGLWKAYATFEVNPDETVEHRFPDAFQAYWVRLSADTDVTATAMFTYD